MIKHNNLVECSCENKVKSNSIEDLLDYCYKHKDEFIKDFDSVQEGLEQFNCLIVLIEDSVIISIDELKEYGMP